MSGRRQFILLLLVISLAAPVIATARVRVGGVVVSGGYAAGPWYPWYGPYGYSPFWYGPYAGPFWQPYSPAFFSPFARGPHMGEVQVKTPYRDAELYINGAYAGLAKERKSIWLRPGAYDLELRPENKGPIQKRVYVLSGKTLKVQLGDKRHD